MFCVCVRAYGCPELNFGINRPILRKPFTFIVSNNSMADTRTWGGSGNSPRALGALVLFA